MAVVPGRPDALAAALTGPPFDQLRVDLRQARLDRLAGDPVARGASDLLARGALLCFAVALVALVLLVVAERRDEAAQLYTWESDGVAPGTLRRALFLRAVAVAVVGVPAGAADRGAALAGHGGADPGHRRGHRTRAAAALRGESYVDGRRRVGRSAWRSRWRVCARGGRPDRCGSALPRRPEEVSP